MEIDRFDALHPVYLICKGQVGTYGAVSGKRASCGVRFFGNPCRSKKRREAST
jgi:N-acyl-L-homoserine lactone synthetase